MTDNLYINFSSVLTILLAFVILYNNYRRNVLAIYFFVFLVLNSLWNLSYGLLAFGGSAKFMALLIGNIAPLFFLIPPILYYILRTHLYGRQKWTMWQLFHLLPFVIHSFNMYPYIVSSYEFKLSVANQILGNLPAFRDLDFHFFYPQKINVFARNLQHIGYIIAGIVLLRRYKNNLITSGIVRSSRIKILYRWFYIIYFMYSVIVVTRLLSVTGVVETYALIDSTESMRIYLNISSFFLMIIPAALILFPRYVFEFSPLTPDVQSEADFHNGVSNSDVSVAIVCEKAKTSEDKISLALGDEECSRIYDEIIAYTSNNNPFLRSNFRLQDLSMAINVPVHKIRTSLKVIRGLSFSDFKNENRIEYACQLLKRDYHNKTIEAIALDSGFASVSNFYEMFKAVKGVSPSMWMMQYLNPNPNMNVL